MTPQEIRAQFTAAGQRAGFIEVEPLFPHSHPLDLKMRRRDAAGHLDLWVYFDGDILSEVVIATDSGHEHRPWPDHDLVAGLAMVEELG